MTTAAGRSPVVEAPCRRDHVRGDPLAQPLCGQCRLLAASQRGRRAVVRTGRIDPRLHMPTRHPVRRTESGTTISQQSAREVAAGDQRPPIRAGSGVCQSTLDCSGRRTLPMFVKLSRRASSGSHCPLPMVSASAHPGGLDHLVAHSRPHERVGCRRCSPPQPPTRRLDPPPGRRPTQSTARAMPAGVAGNCAESTCSTVRCGQDRHGRARGHGCPHR